MIDAMDPRLSVLSLGPERRALMRELGMPVGIGDFSDDEWSEIEAEASGTRAYLEAQLAGC